MNPTYLLSNPDRIVSPSLLFYKDVIRKNIERTVAIAGSPERLRPHVKTHKTREIARMWLAAGVTKHKCATIAEAEMLASCGAPDILIAYPMAGPNCGRLVALARKFRETRFGVTIDHPKSLAMLAAVTNDSPVIDAYLDIDCGMHRTGIEPGSAAFELARHISNTPGLRFAGLHVYDGHNHQESSAERKDAVTAIFRQVSEFRAQLKASGIIVHRIVAGGTPTFAAHAQSDTAGLECSPGTLSLHDFNYGTRYPELGITPAALLLTRVISRPTADRITLDLGYKAVSPDQPAGKRCVLLNVPAYEAILQNEEHFVVRSSQAEQFQPGDIVYAMPAHVCPTVALHRHALVVENGAVVDRWEIIARDRELSV